MSVFGTVFDFKAEVIVRLPAIMNHGDSVGSIDQEGCEVDFAYSVLGDQVRLWADVHDERHGNGTGDVQMVISTADILRMADAIRAKEAR